MLRILGQNIVFRNLASVLTLKKFVLVISVNLQVVSEIHCITFVFALLNLRNPLFPTLLRCSFHIVTKNLAIFIIKHCLP